MVTLVELTLYDNRTLWVNPHQVHEVFKTKIDGKNGPFSVIYYTGHRSTVIGEPEEIVRKLRMGK